jgi:hypothetical protein
MLRDKNPSPQRRGSKLQPTSAYATATWASDVPLANQILPLIKSYQTPIPPIPSKLHSNYLVINLEIGFFQQTTNIRKK